MAQPGRNVDKTTYIYWNQSPNFLLIADDREWLPPLYAIDFCATQWLNLHISTLECPLKPSFVKKKITLFNLLPWKAGFFSPWLFTDVHAENVITMSYQYSLLNKLHTKAPEITLYAFDSLLYYHRILFLE